MTERTVHEVDIAILGLGSAGERLAQLCAEAGLRVVAFEPGRVGGECPFVACIPTKALLHDANHLRPDWSAAIARRDELTSHGDDTEHADTLVGAGVVVVRERAAIVGERAVRSDGHEVRAERVVIATGAAAVRPTIDGIDRPSVWTSEDAMTSGERPDRLVIIGGGPIGSEMSQIYTSFGSTVTICEQAEVLTADAEPEVAAALLEHLGSIGVDVRLGVEVSAVVEGDGSDLVVLADGTRLSADRVLLAAGTAARLDDVGLDAVGLDPSEVVIDADGSVGGSEWLFAAGDVTPQSHWTHGANSQAAALADRFLDRPWPAPPSPMPRCVFTSPPLGVVGTTRAAAIEDGMDAVVGLAHYRDISRHATDEAADGLAAVVVDRATGAIVGGSIFGPRADDLIQIVSVLIATGTDIADARRMVFPFPTFAQVVEGALLDAADQVNEPEGPNDSTCPPRLG